ncbi:murein L,D-transpeptidase family protein [Emticicia sp. BO119]|uniref:L,D-transpeptidase family protein n=1 Tax=Emticicia sp. BO119 TaxID=2757768 RepID=UPI0015F0D5BB|nr:L,D-transpeptidase family protein [Emticicia sp. BO119]MBA4853571.1 L,D-transpeptidase family protein [Emticicia sp. BO119]
MKTLIVTILSMALISSEPDFFKKQLEFSRVAKAYALKGKEIDRLLKIKNINTEKYDLFLRAFKTEKQLEVWAKNKNQGIFTLIKTYKFCKSSGELGPKRREGDNRIPEGFYQVNNFNPQSTYHLSFKINYPNKSDMIFGDKKHPGNDIYIHGKCVTIGCIPLGDNNIEELYLLAAKARSSGGVIHVHIFPANLKKAAYAKLQSEYHGNQELLKFWSDLKPVFDAFEENKCLPQIGLDDKGRYRII